MVRGRGPRSLHPDPARSYEHARAKRATRGCTKLQSTEKSPAPASRMTVGCEVRVSPAQCRCSRHPPTSTNWPGGGSGGAVVGSWARVAIGPLRSKNPVSASERYRVRSSCISTPGLSADGRRNDIVAPTAALDCGSIGQLSRNSGRGRLRGVSAPSLRCGV